MSKRNTYDESGGVARVRWTKGAPNKEDAWRPVLIEEWRPDLSLPWSDTPWRVAVHAAVRLVRYYHPRVGQDSPSEAYWQRMTNGGNWEAWPDGPAYTRRWAPLPQRTWTANITLDGWAQERSK